MICANSGVKLATFISEPLEYLEIPVKFLGKCCATDSWSDPAVAYFTLLCTADALWLSGPRSSARIEKIQATSYQSKYVYIDSTYLEQLFCHPYGSLAAEHGKGSVHIASFG